MKHTDLKFKRYTWLDRGSDERQYCVPGVNLPITSIMRSKYGAYTKYHTSLDDLELVTSSGLQGGFNALRKALEIIDKKRSFEIHSTQRTTIGEDVLYPTLNAKDSRFQAKNPMMNMLTYYGDHHSLLEITELIDEPFWEVVPIMKKLIELGLFSIVMRES